MDSTVSTRATIITRRTYNRPLNNDGTVFESWEETVNRVVDHQSWLWRRAKGNKSLTKTEWAELNEFKELMLSRKSLPSGRTLWLGGTDVAKKRESSMFNCAFTEVQTVHDMVDVLWLLLQGCGVGFKPVVGILNGFTQVIPELEVVRSQRTAKGGRETNLETWDPMSRTWTLSIGDSAEAWAKSIGKLMAGKYSARKLVLDFSEIRPAGERLKGYGWISSGDEAIVKAYTAIFHIMNKSAGKLLTRMNILDIVNWLGTVLSSRRSAEICLFEYGQPEWREFAVAKDKWWEKGNKHRTQSNNTLLFYNKPSRAELKDLFNTIIGAGGSEPGFGNAQYALSRAPWFRGFNPCAEILLGNKSFCNLTEIDLGKFNGDWDGLMRAAYIIGRANYRQTCVNLDDGILQRTWHELNQFLRLCGVGLTGIVRWEHLDADWAFQCIEDAAVKGANSMAIELGTPLPKMVTTVKPSGTLSKIMDTTEGVHKPLGKYIFNNVNFGKHDPIIPVLKEAGYRMFPNPTDDEGILVTLPVAYEDVKFEEYTLSNGETVEVNRESAVEQLGRYKRLMTNYVQHNCSITVSYDPSEVDDIIDWIDQNWDSYVGVSFLFRNDPTKTAADLGYLYLPQEVVTKQRYDEYVAILKPINLDSANSFDELEEKCSTGACPIK